jgi:CDGSH-type Zn-finger protein
MTRLVQRLRNGPYLVTVGGKTKSICGCGLSATQPFCDGTHQITKSEELALVYWYDSGMERHDVGERYPDIRSDEPTEDAGLARASSPSFLVPQPVSDR